MPLTDVELRVLGCLVEKQMTTPDHYPLTMNALIGACNQTTNRDPVVDYDETLVFAAIRSLQDRRLVRAVHRPGQRVVKYRHATNDEWRLGPPQAALLAVLMLRGPQTTGELRSRTGRYGQFESLAGVEDALAALADHGLAVRLERRPGEKEARWSHTVGESSPSSTPPETEAAEPPQPAPTTDRLDRLEAEQRALRAELRELRALLDDLTS